MTEVLIRVTGIPGAQGSKRVTRYGGLIEASTRVAPWRQDIRFAALRAFKQNPIEGPVSISLEFIFKRPKSHFGTGRNARTLKPSAPKYLTSKGCGDIDKLCRSTLDGLSMSSGGSVLNDDSQVVSLSAEKRYVQGNEHQGAYISIMPLT